MKQLTVTIEGKKWLSPLRNARFAEVSLSELQKQNVAQESAGCASTGKKKKCSRCNLMLPATSDYFYSDKKMRLGLKSHCKSCDGNKGKRLRYLVDGRKVCSKCNSVLDANEENFNKNKSSLDGLRPECKKCQSEFKKSNYAANKNKIKAKSKKYYNENKDKYNEQSRRWRAENKNIVRYHQRKYKYLKRRSIPSWFESERVLIEKVYEMAASLGMHVDHIVPINSKLVCGLHCWHNLQLLTPSENRSKSNVYWPDMP